MNWEAIGAVGEIPGASGVVITLLYLATQIRQSTRQARAGAYQTLTDTGAAIIQMIVQDKEMAHLWYMGLNGELCNAEPAEWTRFQLALGSWLEAMESIFMQHRLGGVDDELFDSRMQIVKVFFQSSDVVRAWDQLRFTFSRSFSEYVDKNLR